VISQIKYHFARLIVFAFALHVLDVSIDIDYITSNVAAIDSERYDDIDSISEFVIEGIYGDNNLIPESNKDDQNPLHKQVNKGRLVLFFPVRKTGSDINAISQNSSPLKFRLTNTDFLFEDYSNTDYNPPDFSGDPLTV
jgi:hypothetical protein